jgi:hypothetical protein
MAMSPWARAAKAKRQLTVEELEELWRPSPEFVGPVGPPMWLWLKDADAQRAWELAMNLAPSGR